MIFLIFSASNAQPVLKSPINEPYIYLYWEWNAIVAFVIGLQVHQIKRAWIIESLNAVRLHRKPMHFGFLYGRNFILPHLNWVCLHARGAGACRILGFSQVHS